MRTIGKVVDASVIIGGLAVGYGGGIAVLKGIKEKKGGVIAIGVLTILISIYAMREAVNKINDLD